jgi:hypothetical protein
LLKEDLIMLLIDQSIFQIPITRSRVGIFIEKIIVAELVKKSSSSMEPEGPLPCPQEYAIRPYSEPLEPEGPLPCPQEYAIRPYPEPFKSSSHPIF